jgi:thymidylate synthase
MKAEVAKVAIDTEIKRADGSPEEVALRIKQSFPFDLMDDDFIASAEKMSSVYSAIAAFENSARKFIQDRLLEEFGADWWDKAVSEAVRKEAQKRKDEEAQHRYHGSRGTSMIFYTQMGDLVSIIQAKWQEAFEDHLPSIDWARQIFKAVERSRNVIMHAGELSMNDVQRVGMNIRDWLQQVGA